MARGTIRLWGAAEITARTGYGREWVQRIISRRDFPAPAIDPPMKMGNAWWPEDVEAWIAANRPELVDGPKAPDAD